jgi:hypothetical protein
MSTLSDFTRYHRNEDFVARKIAGETVLVPIRQQLGDLESIYTLDEVATFIWERLVEPLTIAAVVAAVEDAFEGDPAQIREDVEEFLGQLLTLHAIRPKEERPDVPEARPHP